MKASTSTARTAASSTSIDSKKEFETAARISALLAKGGLERRAVTPAEIKSIEPALSGKYYGGFYTQTDFTGDIHKFTNGLAKACERHRRVDAPVG